MCTDALQVEIESMEAILKGFDDAFRGPSIIDAMEREQKHVEREALKSPRREPTTFQARYIANDIVMATLCIGNK